MADSRLQESITVSCPRGHRLRGDASLIGKQVKCPKCQSVFAIGEPRKVSVTESSVMRILGDGPGELPPPVTSKTTESQDCPRCGCSNPKTASVCSDCECYMGLMPNFLQKMFPSKRLNKA